MILFQQSSVRTSNSFNVKGRFNNFRLTSCNGQPSLREFDKHRQVLSFQVKRNAKKDRELLTKKSRRIRKLKGILKKFTPKSSNLWLATD